MGPYSGIQNKKIKINSWISLLILQFFIPLIDQMYSANLAIQINLGCEINLVSWSLDGPDWGFIQGTLVKPRAWHRSLIVSTKPERIMHIGGDYGYESGQVIGGDRTNRKFISFMLRLGRTGKCSNPWLKNGGRGAAIDGKRPLEVPK